MNCFTPVVMFMLYNYGSHSMLIVCLWLNAAVKVISVSLQNNSNNNKSQKVKIRKFVEKK